MDKTRLDRRAALGLAVGVSIGARSWWAEASAESDDAIALWVADRDAQAVIGLDRGLLHRVCVPVAHPVAIASATNGGAWVVSALAASRRQSVFEWLRLDSTGQLLARGELRDFVSLRTAPEGGAWVLSGKGRQLEHLSGMGEAGLRNGVHVGGELASGVGSAAVYEPTSKPVDWKDCSFDCARAMAVNLAGQVLVNGDDDWFDLLEDGKQVDCPGVLEASLDICAVGEDWWILSEGVLLQLNGNMELIEMYELRNGGTALIPSEFHDGVWLLDRKGMAAELYGPQQRRRVNREWEQPGACTGIELARGALLIATPGALIVLDETGQARAGQGGFREVVDIAVAAHG